METKTGRIEIVEQIQNSLGDEGYETIIDKENNQFVIKGTKFDATGRIT